VTVPLLTSHWRALLRFHAAHGLRTATFMPVATSVGLPRSTPWAEGLPRIREVTPWGLLKADPFEPAYVARLDRYGVELIAGRFEAIYEAYRRPLVLLCWELPGEPCHRLLFARWWEEHTGQRVPEAEGLDPLSISRAVALRLI
jgi:hypothetical protein